MAGSPVNAAKDENVEFDLDLELDDLDGLDDEELQRLLEEDPALEEELRALEQGEKSAEDTPPMVAPPPAVDADVDPDTGLTTASASDYFEAEDQPDPEDTAEFDDPLDQEDLTAPPPVSAEAPPMVGADEPDNAEASTIGDVPPGEVSDVDVSALRIAPIPRINIHAFCVNSRTTELIEQASVDRRLAKAHLTVHSGGVERALQVYEGESSPNLIIIEGGHDASELINGLDNLANYCDPSTRVICIGALNDIQLYRELMLRGVSEYVVQPRSPLQIISAVGELYADPDAPAVGKSYMFVGARGGVGSSTVSHNVAWALAEEYQSDSVLMDMDLAFGTVSLDFEHDPSQGLAEALSAPERLDDVLLDRLLQKVTDRLSLFVAPNLLDRDYDMPADSYETVVEMVRKTAPSVVVDLPHIWTDWSRQMLQTADEIVIVATPDLASFRNTKNIIENIRAQRTNDSEPLLVLNQVGVPKRPEVPAEQFEEAIGITPFASIPWDPVSFGVAATNAQSILEAAPKSKAATVSREIAAQLLGVQMFKSKGFSLKGLFSKSR